MLRNPNIRDIRRAKSGMQRMSNTAEYKFYLKNGVFKFQFIIIIIFHFIFKVEERYVFLILL